MSERPSYGSHSAGQPRRQPLPRGLGPGENVCAHKPDRTLILLEPVPLDCLLSEARDCGADSPASRRVTGDHLIPAREQYFELAKVCLAMGAPPGRLLACARPLPARVRCRRKALRQCQAPVWLRAPRATRAARSIVSRAHLTLCRFALPPAHAWRPCRDARWVSSRRWPRTCAQLPPDAASCRHGLSGARLTPLPCPPFLFFLTATTVGCPYNKFNYSLPPKYLESGGNGCSYFTTSTALPEAFGWVVVLAIGGIFSIFTSILVYFDEKYGGTSATSEHFSTAGRSVSYGLTGCDIVSKWTWAATLLQSSNVAYKFGVSGPFWYGAGKNTRQGPAPALA